MKRGSHILCSKRNDTKQGQAARHGKAEAGTQLKLAFDPVNKQFLQYMLCAVTAVRNNYVKTNNK